MRKISSDEIRFTSPVHYLIKKLYKTRRLHVKLAKWFSCSCRDSTILLMAPKGTYQTQIQWQSLLKFACYPPLDSSSAEELPMQQYRLIQLVQAQIPNKRIMRVDLRHWQDDKALNGISMSPEETILLHKKLQQTKIEPACLEMENDRSLSVLVEPQPIIMQVATKRISAMLLDAQMKTCLEESLPVLLWTIDMKGGTAEEMKKDILIALTAINCRGKVSATDSDMIDVVSLAEELKSYWKSKPLKMAVNKSFIRLNDMFSLTTTEMNNVCNDFFAEIDSFEGEVLAQVVDAISNEKNDGLKTGDYFQMKNLLGLLDKEEDSAKKRKFTNGKRMRQKLSGGPPSKYSKHIYTKKQ